MKRLARASSLLIASSIIVASASVPAHATYPGVNGEIAYLTRYGGRALDPDGSGDHRLSASRTPIEDVAFSADGSQAVIAETTRRGDRIVLLQLDTGARSMILAAKDAPTNSVYSVSLSPDGSSVVFCDGFPGHLYTVGIDGSALTKVPSSQGYCYADWGVNDRIVASKGIFNGDGDRVVTTMDPDGANRVDIATFPAAKSSWRIIYVLVPSWAPDGSSVVFTAQRNRIHPDIWAVDADGMNLRKLTDTKAKSESGPVYSPDGTQVVFSLNSAAGADLWLMGADGSTPAQLTHTPGRGEYSVAWQPL